jgi:uncharacterized repeat protein (TIGR03803 family)
VVIDKAGNL